MADPAYSETRDHTFTNARISIPRIVNGQIVFDNAERGERTQGYDAASMQKLTDLSLKESAVYEPAVEMAAAYGEKAKSLRTLDERIQQSKLGNTAPAFMPTLALNS